LEQVFIQTFESKINAEKAKFKLFGGEAAKVFKCAMAKMQNAANRLQSALEY